MNRAVERSSPTPSHLYVLDNANKAVYRFPLSQDGLPAIQPDGVLYPIGAVYPEGLAIDSAGNIFVADAHGWGGAVAEFAAGATGLQQPISILNLSADGPDRLYMDVADRLYVHFNANQDVAIFAKGAQGNDSPLSIVPPYQQLDYAIDFLVVKSGALYILNESGPVTAYDHPLRNPQHPTRFMWPDSGFEAFFDQSLAIDESTDRLYIQFAVRDSRNWNKINYGVRSPTGTSAAVDPLIFTGDCGSAGKSSVFGTVIVGKYLIVSCASNSDVLVYRTDHFGRQRLPVEVVGQGKLLDPLEIAVGP